MPFAAHHQFVARRITSTSCSRFRIVAALSLLAPISTGNALAQWSPMPGGGFDPNRVRAAIVRDDGSGPAVYAAGRFTSAGGVLANNIARWNGQNWSALGSGIEPTTLPGGSVLALASFDDGLGGGSQLYAGGVFTTAGGVAAKNIARWDGHAWHALPIPIDAGAVFCMEVFDDGSGPALYIGGSFTSVGGQPARNLIKWDGLTWSEVGGGFVHVGEGLSSWIMTLAAYDDGDGMGLAAGGYFNRAGGNPVGSLALWRNKAWNAIGGVVGFYDSDGEVAALVAWPDAHGPELICQGRFTQIGGTNFNNMARWDGNSWIEVSPISTISHDGVGRLRVARTSDGCPELFAQFDFDSMVNFIMRWDGRRWRSLDGGINLMWGFVVGQGIVPYLDMVEFNNQLIVVGAFSAAGGVPAPGAAIWGLDALYPCQADINGDQQVNVSDLLNVISHWGICAGCSADTVPCGGDDVVNVSDLLVVITHWGPCP